MRKNFLHFFSFVLFLESHFATVVTAIAVYKMSDLLKNQLDLQISLVIPEHYGKAFAQHPSTALEEAIDFLVSEEAPLRLFFNRTESKPSPITTHAIRYVRNQRVWLVIVVVLRKSETLNLFRAMLGCAVEGRLRQVALLHKDVIQLVVDESVDTWDRAYAPNIKRHQVPLYFLLMRWYGNSFITPNASLLRDTCGCDDSRAFVTLEDFIPKLGNPIGLETFLKNVDQIKKDFRGRRVRIQPARPLNGSWEGKWKKIYTEFSFRTAYSNKDSSFVGVLHAFVSIHNLTFDIDNDVDQKQVDVVGNLILMSTSFSMMVAPVGLADIPIVSLERFGHYRTVYFATGGQQEPFLVSSLIAPFSDIFAVLIMCGLSLCVAVILTIFSNKSLQLFEAALLTLLGHIGTEWKTRGMSNAKLSLFYTVWLLLTSRIISTMYTNVLQSITIVPQIRYNGLTFEEMIERNFTFESAQADWMKKFSAGTQRNMLSCELGKESILQKEKLLAARLIDSKETSTWKIYIENHSEDRLLAEMVSEETEEYYKLSSSIHGWDAVFGKELFYNLPAWWSYQFVERGSLLAHSMELSKQVGLVDHFDKLYLRLHLKRIEADVYSEMTTYEIADRMNKGILPITFDDSLLLESFCVLLYGASVSTLCFFAEILIVALWNLAACFTALYVILVNFASF